jgi:hypothetical protein
MLPVVINIAVALMPTHAVQQLLAGHTFCMLMMSVAQPLEFTKAGLVVRRVWAVLSVFTLDLRNSQLECYTSGSFSFEQLFWLNLLMVGSILLPALCFLVLWYLLIIRQRPSSALRVKLANRIKLLSVVWTELAALPILRYSFEAASCFEAHDRTWRLGIHLQTVCWKGTHVIVFAVAVMMIGAFVCMLILSVRRGGIVCANSCSAFDKRGVFLYMAFFCLAARTLFSAWYEAQLAFSAAPASMLIVSIVVKLCKGRIKGSQALRALLLPASMITVAAEHYALIAMQSSVLSATGIAVTVSAVMAASTLAFSIDSTRRLVKLAASQGLWSTLTACTLLAGPYRLTPVEPLSEGQADTDTLARPPAASVSGTADSKQPLPRGREARSDAKLSLVAFVAETKPGGHGIGMQEDLKLQWAIPAIRSLPRPHVPTGAAIVEGDELTLEDLSDESASTDGSLMLNSQLTRTPVFECPDAMSSDEISVADVAASEEEMVELQSLEGDRAQSAHSSDIYSLSGSSTGGSDATSSEGPSGAEDSRRFAQHHAQPTPAPASASLGAADNDFAHSTTRRAARATRPAVPLVGLSDALLTTQIFHRKHQMWLGRSCTRFLESPSMNSQRAANSKRLRLCFARRWRCTLLPA